MMRLALSLLAAVLVAGCSNPSDVADRHGAAQVKSPSGGMGGPPALPLYQMRESMPAGNRLAAGRSGEALFSHICGACHLAGGMGTNLLTKQRLALGEKPEMALLANRKDMTQSYVQAVVRNGKVAMPPLTRAEVTDAELEAIARYLGKGGE